MSSRLHYALRIEGMTCDGCARHVSEALRSVSGVEEARVGHWKSGQASVTSASGVEGEQLVRAVQKAGYHAAVLERRPLDGDRRVPSRDGEFDLMILGGGSAAFAGAIKAAELGAKVAIVEKGTIGGTCVNIGCVPSKTLIKAAEICYR
ncbi:MAG: cation transporter, partial [Acidobacteria bacterium]|nr:cation transporter [Acidobacteriota bacterium]